MAATNGGNFGSCNHVWLGSFNCDPRLGAKVDQLGGLRVGQGDRLPRGDRASSSPEAGSGRPCPNGGGLRPHRRGRLGLLQPRQGLRLDTSAAAGSGRLPNVSDGKSGAPSPRLRRPTRPAKRARAMRSEKGTVPFCRTARRRAAASVGRRTNGDCPLFADAQGHDGSFHWFFPISRSRVMRKMRSCWSAQPLQGVQQVGLFGLLADE